MTTPTNILDTPRSISRFQIAAQMSAIKLEGLGMKHSSGKSALAHCKRIYNLKGTRAEVLAKMGEMKSALA